MVSTEKPRVLPTRSSAGPAGEEDRIDRIMAMEALRTQLAAMRVEM